MTIIASEIDRFNRLSATWWNNAGPMRPLHVINELRLGYLRQLVAEQLDCTVQSNLEGLRIRNVGCGAGLLCAPLARSGAQVTGIDAAEKNVGAARILLVVSTIDRTWNSLAVAIVGAEYVFRVLLKGAHDWRRFVRPAELESAARRAGLALADLRGMRYLPVMHRASWVSDTSVNYIAAFARAETTPLRFTRPRH